MIILSIEDELIEYGNSLKGVDVYFKTEWDCYYFSLLGKMVALLSDNGISLKGKPDKNIILRQKYNEIIPGYHLNKKHWNTIDLKTGNLSIDFLKEMIDESYFLVYKKLTLADREIVDEMN